MRVLLISHTCQSRTEGQPKARWLAAHPDIELKVLVPDRWLHYGKWRKPDPVLAEEFDLHVGKVSMPWADKAQYYLHWYPQIGNLLRTFKPDVIDLWEEPWGLVSAHTCYLRNRIVPSARIVTETEQNINKTLPFPFERFRSYTLRNAAFAVGRNREAVEILRQKGYSGDAEVVPNAVDTALFRPMDRQLCRAKFGLKGFVAGYVGRIVEEKGLADMVDALKECPQEVNLLFVGSGSYETELKQRISNAGVKDRIKLMPARPLQELPEIMNAIDVLVLPSRTTATWKEQFGRVIIEAHACGTPVAGSNSGAIAEVVGEGGIVFEENCPSSLAGALKMLCSDPGGARAMGELGRKGVNEKYTWQRVAERMYSIYQRSAGSPAYKQNP